MAQSHEMRVLLADNSAGTDNPIALAARSCDLLGTERFGRDPGKRGSRQQFSCGARVLGEDIGGGFNFYPTVTQLDWLFERMIGDNISGYPAAAATPKETLPSVYAFVDKGEDIFRYDLLKIASVSFSFTEGDYMDVRVDFVGSEETGSVSWPGTPPSIDCASEYVTHDATLTIGGTEFPFKNLTLNIDNSIADNQQENNLNRLIFESQDLIIGLTGTFGYRTDTSTLYRRGIAGDVAFLFIDDSTQSYQMTFPNVKIPGSGPTVPETGEITMSLEMAAYATTSASQIAISKL